MIRLLIYQHYKKISGNEKEYIKFYMRIIAIVVDNTDFSVYGELFLRKLQII